MKVDKKLIEELCQESIKERIKGIRGHWFGGGLGRSTQLKEILVKVTGLDFSLIRRAIDDLDTVLGWDTKANKKKWENFYTFLHPQDYEKKGLSENYFIVEFGGLMADFLYYEATHDHVHKYHSKSEIEDHRYSRLWREESTTMFHGDGQGNTYRGSPAKKCYTCGEWKDVGKGAKVCQNHWHVVIEEPDQDCEECK